MLASAGLPASGDKWSNGDTSCACTAPDVEVRLAITRLPTDAVQTRNALAWMFHNTHDFQLFPPGIHDNLKATGVVPYHCQRALRVQGTQHGRGPC